MALTKTKADLLGTQASPHSVTTGEVHTGSLRDVTTMIGAMYVFKVVYASSFNGASRPKLEIFTAAENDNAYIDTEAYELVELPYAASGTYQISIPLRFVEGIGYTNYKITAPTFTVGTMTVYLGVVETSL